MPAAYRRETTYDRSRTSRKNPPSDTYRPVIAICPTCDRPAALDIHTGLCPECEGRLDEQAGADFGPEPRA